MHSVLLLVDDEQLRATLIPLLSGLGYDVTSSSTAADALEDGPAVTAHVILVDVPEGRLDSCLDDVEALQAAVDAPVVLLLSSLDHDVLSTTARAHPAGYALKPVSGRELASAFELALFRRNIERQSAARERWYTTTLRSIADAVITADDVAHITFMNPTAEQLTGWSEADALGRPLNDVFAVTADANEKSAEETSQPVLRLVPRSGPSIIIEHNASPIIEESGALHGVVVVFRDITEQRRLAQRLALADRMVSIGTLAAGIAHELNNPLAFVTSNIEFALGELTRLTEELAPTNASRASLDALSESLDALGEARDGAARAATIVKDMKVFTRAEADGKLLVDVNRAASLAVRLVNTEIKHRAELELRLGSAPPVLADEGKLVQVLVNVLTNAVQALDDKPAHTISVSTGLEGDRVVIRISDTGKGIPAEHIGRIFEPFFTTKPVGEGLGLGLSIAHTIVTGFGGTITADSVPDEGTAVVISLPPAEPVHAAVTDKRRSAAAAMSRARVLVVDDETLICTAIRRILTKHGIEVVVEGRGRAAFDRLANGERYDVVLCDLMMPGFSGVDLYEGLDDAAPDMKSRIVFMTGNAFTPRASELFENTQNVRLEKPFVPADLTRAVTEVMTRHGERIEL